MPDNDSNDGEKAKEAAAGEAQRMDSQAVRARAETRELMSPQELDARQERIGRKRRKGGPSLEGEPDAPLSAARGEGADVPSTEAEEPENGE